MSYCSNEQVNRQIEGKGMGPHRGIKRCYVGLNSEGKKKVYRIVQVSFKYFILEEDL